MQLLSLAANLDRGQSYNPTSSEAYKERMETATAVCHALIAETPPLPTSLDALDGEWELAFTNVAHGIFRSSPFFLAIQQAYAKNADPPAPEKAELFFRLHELQTCSCNASTYTVPCSTSRYGFELLPDPMFDGFESLFCRGDQQDWARGSDHQSFRRHAVLGI